MDAPKTITAVVSSNGWTYQAYDSYTTAELLALVAALSKIHGKSAAQIVSLTLALHLHCL